MMITNIGAKLVLICMAILAVGSCVSVKLPTQEGTTKAANVNASAPSKAFSEIYQSHVDRAWRNETNGNTISYFTECMEGGGPSIENIERGLVQSVQSPKVLEKNKINVAGESASRSLVEGGFEGASSKVEMVIFKKGNCTYIVTYVGASGPFEQNHDDFKDFLKSFRVIQ